MKQLSIIFSLLFLSFCLSSTSYAKQGNLLSQENLINATIYQTQLQQALIHYNKQHYKKALPMLEKKAKQGEKIAQYLLAIMYVNNLGVKQNLITAYAWLTVANEQKNNKWMKNLLAVKKVLSEPQLVKAEKVAIKFASLYGAKTQKLNCHFVKNNGSNLRNHLCEKKEIKRGFYYNQTQLSE